MASGCFRFAEFSLDPQNRSLLRDGAPVELSSRYFDALHLMVREQGRLVSKDRFLDEVWKGVPVTDEALTQCVRTLRRCLGDEPARPRFIETVPKHGYRFIAPVEAVDGPGSPTPKADASPVGRGPAVLSLASAAVAGGGAAGLVGGLFYGFAGVAQGPGAASALLVLVGLTMVIGVLGGAGVGLGIAAVTPAGRAFGPAAIPAAAFGGMAVGAVIKLLGLDAFDLLFGQAPSDITGAREGLILGAAVGLGAWLGGLGPLAASRLRATAVAGLCGGVAGILIALAGGRLMAGSLDLLARQFPASRLDLGGLGALFGEAGFGPVTQAAVSGLEGALFSAGVVGALILARRRLARP